MTSPCSHITLTKEFPPGVTVTQEAGADIAVAQEGGVAVAPTGVEVYCRAPIVILDFIYDGDWNYDGSINHGESEI